MELWLGRLCVGVGRVGWGCAVPVPARGGRAAGRRRRGAWACGCHGWVRRCLGRRGRARRCWWTSRSSGRGWAVVVPLGVGGAGLARPCWSSGSWGARSDWRGVRGTLPDGRRAGARRAECSGARALGEPSWAELGGAGRSAWWSWAPRQLGCVSGLLPRLLSCWAAAAWGSARLRGGGHAKMNGGRLAISFLGPRPVETTVRADGERTRPCCAPCSVDSARVRDALQCGWGRGLARAPPSPVLGPLGALGTALHRPSRPGRVKNSCARATRGWPAHVSYVQPSKSPHFPAVCAACTPPTRQPQPCIAAVKVHPALSAAPAPIRLLAYTSLSSQACPIASHSGQCGAREAERRGERTHGPGSSPNMSRRPLSSPATATGASASDHFCADR